MKINQFSINFGNVRRTTIIATASFALVVGVLLGKYILFDSWWLPCFVLFLPIIYRRRFLFMVVLSVAAVLVGNMRIAAGIRAETPIARLNGQKIQVVGAVVEDGYYDSKKRTSFLLQTTKIITPISRKISATIRVSAFGVSSAQRGDTVLVTGKIINGGGNVAGAIYYASVVNLSSGNSRLDTYRRSFVSGLNNSLPEPEGPFAAGLLIGQRTGLPQKWQDILQNAGLSHIVAVSGYNLTILVRFVRRLFRKYSRYQTVVFSFGLVALFMMITGNSPSIMRAAIVVVLMQLAWYFGRQIKPMVVIGLAAAISALIDPFLVLRSVSWYLSFAAFFGVLVIAPLFHKSNKKRVGAWLGLISESLSAEIMTLPIIAITFGRVSLVGIIANVLVVPLVPISMALSLLAGLAGWFVPAISGWLALPTHLLLNIMLKISAAVASMPGSQILLNIDMRAVIFIYGMLLAAVIVRGRKRHWKGSLNIEDMVK